MNKQIMKERQQTPWLILISVLVVISMISLLIWRSSQWSQTETLGSANTSSPPSSPVPAISTALPISGINSLAVGQPAPDFTLKTLEDQDMTLSDLQGQAVLINFWASWCTPCRAEMPVLQQTYQTYQADGLVILAVNVTSQDTASDAAAFVEELQLTMPVLLDEAETVSKLYRVLGLPTSIFVDRQGIIKRIYFGPMNEREIEQFVTEILE